MKPNPIIVALDVESAAEARALVARLGGSVSFYKVGMELYAAAGMDFVRELLGQGKDVFLDLKFYDIPETVKRAVAQVARTGVRFLTVHAVGSVMRAAVEGRAASDLKLLAVTVLTSFGRADLDEMGYNCEVSDLVERRARQAMAAGMDGIVASPLEAAALRRIVGPQGDSGDAGRPLGRRGQGRSEARGDAGRGHSRRRRLPGDGPPDHARRGPGRGAGPRCWKRSGAEPLSWLSTKYRFPIFHAFRNAVGSPSFHLLLANSLMRMCSAWVVLNDRIVSASPSSTTASQANSGRLLLSIHRASTNNNDVRPGGLQREYRISGSSRAPVKNNWFIRRIRSAELFLV
jgi:orotidine-5'-phosphate decarboxylase